MPAIAAAASWMEALHMPMREIKKRYTKSEMIIMAWRSQEMAHHMRQRSHSVRKPKQNVPGREDAYDESDDTGLETRLGSVADKLDEGLDLRRLNGSEIQRYMRALGITIPVCNPVPRKSQRT